ncbi:hypothetical protein hp908_0011 [Helicobacter pylori 908]|nr:hypothetical protein hp908_0011 [Helicobacter pylori 908]ADZ49088.1 hypothetical protein hp2017_0010 [Helicobacter pylori 2017]ADZ50684.1 hypothetical protein hp2018_0012 [Helicobacter pylori 2018]
MLFIIFYNSPLLGGGFYLTKPLVLKNAQQKIPIKIKILSLAFH